MRLRDLVEAARHRFEAAGIAGAEAALDAELLMRQVVGWDRAAWLTHRDGAASPEVRHAFERLSDRRQAREPLAYIRGVQEFYGRDFHVGPGVLIPRPETELVVEEALGAAMRHPSASRLPAPMRAADIGTGSGILAITLALEMPAAVVTATDVSTAALAVAGRNAVAHHVAPRIAFAHTPYLDGIDDSFDLIVSNPPYVRARDRPDLPPEVREHEPPQALFGGDDGLRDIAGVVGAAAVRLADGGILVMEIGLGQADAVEGLISAADLRLLGIRQDLQHIPRVVVARK